MVTWLISDLIPQKSEKTKFLKKCLKLFRIKNELEKYFFSFSIGIGFSKIPKNKFTNLLLGFLPLKIKISLKLFFRRIRNKILIWRMKFSKKKFENPMPAENEKKNRFHFWFQKLQSNIFREFWFFGFLRKKVWNQPPTIFWMQLWNGASAALTYKH